MGKSINWRAGYIKPANSSKKGYWEIIILHLPYMHRAIVWFKHQRVLGWHHFGVLYFHPLFSQHVPKLVHWQWWGSYWWGSFWVSLVPFMGTFDKSSYLYQQSSLRLMELATTAPPDLECPLPPKFRLLQLEFYDGTNDPLDHIRVYQDNSNPPANLGWSNMQVLSRHTQGSC